MTVGEARAALERFPDDAEVTVGIRYVEGIYAVDGRAVIAWRRHPSESPDDAPREHRRILRRLSGYDR